MAKMNDHVYILFRSNPKTGDNEVVGVVTKEDSMLAFVNEKTTEVRCAERWSVGEDSKKREEFNNGDQT